MSELYLSIGALSPTPYYLSGLGVNIYSMDELCFYLVQNAYILDNDLLDSKLCDYIADSLELGEISNKIRQMISANEPVGEVVSTILSQTGYCGGEEIRKIRQVLVDNASLSFAAKRKVRGDNLVKACKYTRAIEEYQYVLNAVKAEDDPELCSSIYHNMGTAYAQMFLFDKAADFYKKAYELDNDKESLILYLAAMRMIMKGEDYERMVVRCGYDERMVMEAQRRLSGAENSEPDGEYALEVKRLMELSDAGKISDAENMAEKILDKWKQDYRRSMDAGYL